MRICILCDSFPPLKTAAAGMTEILFNELNKKHEAFVFAASPDKSQKNKNIFLNNFFDEWRYNSYSKRIFLKFLTRLFFHS